MAVNPGREDWRIEHGVFDQFTLQVLDKLRGQGVFDELKSAISIGKEANIFTTHGGAIAKIYRLENRDFKRMLEYLLHDPRYMDVKRRKREIVFAWTQREYRNLMLAREAIRVPKPIAVHRNVLLMEQIGDKEPAPQLKARKPKNPERFFEDIIEQMKKLRKAGMIHGDLSAFNILNDDETPVFIDFSQTTTTDAPNAQELWERDVKNIIVAAKKASVELETADFN